MTLLICPSCSQDVSSWIPECPSCGHPIAKQVRAVVEEERELAREITPYYARVFNRFDENGGRFEPTWNWAAFFWGPIWFIHRGLYVKGLLITVLTVLLLSSLVFPALLLGWYAGMCGNYDYYLLKRRKKHLW